MLLILSNLHIHLEAAIDVNIKRSSPAIYRADIQLEIFKEHTVACQHGSRAGSTIALYHNNHPYYT